MNYESVNHVHHAIRSWQEEIKRDFKSPPHILRIYQKLFVLLHNIKGNLSIYRLSMAEGKTVTDCLEFIRLLAYGLSKLPPNKEQELRSLIESFQSIEELLPFFKNANLENHMDFETEDFSDFFVLFQRKFPQALLDPLGKARLAQARQSQFDLYYKIFETKLPGLIKLEKDFEDLFTAEQGLPVTKVLALSKQPQLVDVTFVGACPNNPHHKDTLLFAGWTLLTSIL